MLSNYEPGTVDDILRAMQIHNYPKIAHLRNFPEIQSQNMPTQQPQHFKDLASGCSRFTPKEQSNPCPKLDRFADEWPNFEEEQTIFYNKKSVENNLPKPQRKPAGQMAYGITNMHSLLQDTSIASSQKKLTKDTEIVLMKHKKNCKNENTSFKQIREIYPHIPISLLWDLFEKCQADANWTMDILLNESETKDFQTLNTQKEIDEDDFMCICDYDKSLSADFSQAVDIIPVEWLNEKSSRNQNQRRQKYNIHNENDVVKHIEQQFVISDHHYSEHTKKIRDNRRNITTSTSVISVDNTDSYQGASKPLDDVNNNEDDDEMIEIDLGVELICQLDQKFGSKTFQSETLKDIKTTVFMPRSLCEQLYATWIESLYHQIEEQKQQSIKEDEEFAKELQVKQPQTQNLFEVSQTRFVHLKITIIPITVLLFSPSAFKSNNIILLCKM